MPGLEQTIIFFLTVIILEFLCEKKFHIKQRIIERIGYIRYIVAVFSLLLLLTVVLICMFPSSLEKGWVRGLAFGGLVFSVIPSRKKHRIG